MESPEINIPEKRSEEKINGIIERVIQHLAFNLFDITTHKAREIYCGENAKEKLKELILKDRATNNGIDENFDFDDEKIGFYATFLIDLKNLDTSGGMYERLQEGMNLLNKKETDK